MFRMPGPTCPTSRAASSRSPQSRASLPAFARLHFPGHTLTGEQLLSAVAEAATSLGVAPARGFKRGGMPWPLLRAGAWFVPMLREIVEMEYLWRVPHALDGSALQRTLGALPATPLHDAQRAALSAFLGSRPQGAAQRLRKQRYRRGAMLLEVNDLHVSLPTPRGPAEALRGVSFALERGDTVGLIGESGCGKSMTALALMGLLPESAQVTGSIRLRRAQSWSACHDDALCELRGDRIGMVFQEPMTALNPLHTIGRQVAEPLRVHRGMMRGAARAEAARLLDRVRLPDAARRLDAYPHQFSGGQRQRVTIAMALACGPDLLIADEPTTALDVTIQGQILDLIAELVAERGMALLLISHDLGVIAQNVQRMLVMYGGSVVESGPTVEVFRRLSHPYTRGLFAARPRLGAPRGRRLATIAGRVPELVDLPAGCPFADRCAYVVAACHDALPPPFEVGPAHRARCIRLDAVPPLDGVQETVHDLARRAGRAGVSDPAARSREPHARLPPAARATCCNRRRSCRR